MRAFYQRTSTGDQAVSLLSLLMDQHQLGVSDFPEIGSKSLVSKVINQRDRQLTGQHETDANVIHRGKKLSKREKKRLRRRAALEAMIGHMKVDGLLERCPLKGQEGDAIHAILCGVGHNLRQMRAFWTRLIFWLWIRCQFRRGLPKTLQIASIAA